MNENSISNYPILNELNFQYEVIKKQIGSDCQQIADEASFNSLTTNLNKAYKKLSAFARDYTSIQLYASNKIVKCFVLNIIDELIKASYDEDFKKKCFRILKKLIDIDFNGLTNEFHDIKDVELYGSILFKLTEQVSDLALEESFFTDTTIKHKINDEDESYMDEDDEEESEFQDNMLTLVCYLFKTVKVKSLIKVSGFKQKYYQFLIIHFTKSLVVLRIVDAICSNLIADHQVSPCSSGLYENTVDIYDFKRMPLKEELNFTIRLNQLFTTSIRSCDFLFNLHTRCVNFSLAQMLIIRIHKNLSIYFQSMIKTTVNKLPINNLKNLIENAVEYNMKRLKKISSNSNQKIKKTKLKNVKTIILIIHHQIPNLKPKTKRQQVISALKSIKIILKKLLDKTSRHLIDLEAINYCFFFIYTIITDGYFKEDFIKTKVLDEFYGLLLSFIDINDSYNTKSLISLFDFSYFECISLANDVSRRVEHLCFENGNDIKSLSDFSSSAKNYAALLASIFNLYMKMLSDEFVEKDFIKVMTKMKQKLKLFVSKSSYYLKIYLKYLSSIFLTIQQYGSKINKEWYFSYLIDAIQVFESINELKFSYKIEQKCYEICLSILKSIFEIFSSDKRLVNFKLTIDEMLNAISLNWSSETEANEPENLIDILKSKLVI